MLRLPAHKRVRSRGFTMIEVVTALAILWVGVLCAEALGAKMLATGRQSRYMALASVLASEKLEDLNHYSPNDPQVCVPAANTSVGSLNSDIMQSTACAPGGIVHYGIYRNRHLLRQRERQSQHFQLRLSQHNRGLLLRDGYADEWRQHRLQHDISFAGWPDRHAHRKQHRAHERNVSPALDRRSESARHGDEAGDRTGDALGYRPCSQG